MKKNTPSTPSRRRAFAAALSAAGILFSGLPVQATTTTWVGNSGTDLATAANWDTTFAPVTADDLVFGTAGTSGTSLTNTLTAGLSLTSITFNSGASAFTLSGNQLTLTGGITNNATNTETISLALALGGANTWSVGSGGTLAVSGIISGANSLTKTGAGTLTLTTATNTFSGGLTINEGTVSYDNNVRLGGTGGTTGAVSLNGGTLRWTGGGVTNSHVITVGASGGTINQVGTGTYILGNANNLTGSGALTITGNGTPSVAGANGGGNVNNGVVVLGNSNTYNGNVFLQDGGILEYANAGGLASGATVTVNNNGVLSTAGVAMARDVTVNSGGALAFQNNGNGSFTGTITLAGSTTVRLQNWWSSAVQNGLISGQITGTGPLTVNSGTGTGAVLTLNNATSDYTGATTISGAVVNIGTGGTLANVNTASSLGKGSAGGSSADLVLSNGTLRYTGFAAQSTDRLFSVGTSGGTLDASGTTTANPLSFTGTGAMGFNSQTGARTLTLTGSNTGSNSLALAIGDNSGATSITKTGAGTWGLAGANTYSGATTVSAGMLSFLNTAAKSASTTVTAAAGAGVGLGVGGSGFYSSADVNSLFADTLSGFSLNATSLIGIDTTAGDFTYDTTGLSGTRTLAKIGANTLIMSGTNTFTGATQVQNGTMEFQSSAAMSSTSALTIGNGGTLSLRADTDTTFTPASLTGSAGTYTIAVNQLTGAGAGKTLTLANTLNMGSTGNNLTVSSTSGDTLLLSSQLALANSSASSNTINLSGANMTLNAGVNFNGATNGPVLTVNANSNTLLINGTWTTGGNRWSGIVVNNGTVTMANGQAGGSSTNNGVYAVLNGGTLNLNSNTAIGGAAAGNNFTINGGTLDNTSGAAITLARNPATTLNGNFAFSTSGGTSANNLSLGTGSVSLGSAVGTSRTITTNGSATLTLGGVIANGTTANSLIKAGTGGLTLTGANTYSGGTTINDGTLTLGNATNTLADAGVINVNGGTLNVANSDTVGAVTLTSGTISGVGTLTGSSYAVQSGTVSANLGGTGSLTKTTSGTVTLSGANTYVGNTTISAGTLAVSSTGSLLFDVADASSTQILGTGSLTFDGTLKLNLTGVTVGSGSWTLVNVGTLTESFTGTFAVVDNSGGLTFVENSNVWTSNDSLWSFSEATGVLTLGAIPEPSTCAAIFGALALAGAAVRRRRKA